jgi:hypothetical protein
MAARGGVGKAGREDFWRQQVDAWLADVARAERAGRAAISVREFCRVRGLREPSFYFWRRELSRRGTGAVFAPVTVRPSAALRAGPPIELEVAGCLLRVTPHFDEGTLARLIAVLRGPAGEAAASRS